MLPSYHFANLGWAAVAGSPPDISDVLILFGYGLAFVTIVARRYRASEKTNS
jgi:hypothetical protein